MTWLRRSAERAAPLLEPPSPAVLPPPAEHPALGLKHALERLPGRGASVLDLGAALAANVAFFNGIHARLRIAHLDDSIETEGLWEASGAIWERSLPALLSLGDGERFDLILAWDLPNYLGSKRWTPLAKRLIERLAPNGSFHLLARVGAEMPADPCRYRIVEPGVLSEEVLVAGTLPAPRFPHAEVEKLHPGLVAPRSYLGKHGVQEYLLEHAAAHDLPPRRVAQARKRPPVSGVIRLPHPPPSKKKPAPAS